MEAHFIDLNSLFTADSKVWIVDTNNPRKPIVKIDKHEFNLIKKGIYKKDETRVSISGKDYWLSKDLYNNIKIKCKISDLNAAKLAFSMQEFMNGDIIENNSFTIHKENIQHLKNKGGDIYIICSKNTKENYTKVINKIESEFEKLGISVKKYYFISETFYNRDEIEISNLKIKLIIQHLIGLKTNGKEFTDEELTSYDLINYYDDDDKVIELMKNINDQIYFIIKNSDSSIYNKIKDLLNSNKKIIINKVTFNRVNKFISYPINIKLPNIVKTFESFSLFSKK